MNVNGKFRSSGDYVKDQHIGREFERAGNFESALKAYDKAFKLALKEPYPVVPPNIFMRKAIIYRKLKMYEDEVAIINEAIKYGTSQTKTTTDKLIARLPKAQGLLEKSRK